MRALVLFSGSGHQDGTEIHEAVFCLTHLEAAGLQSQCCALRGSQASVVNHVTGEKEDAERRMLDEAARIARGQIKYLDQIKTEDYELLVIPGGSGVATSLTNFAEKGDRMEPHPEVMELVRSFHIQRKPIGAVCIAPVILARVLGKTGLTLTVGPAGPAVEAVESWGATYRACQPRHCVVDEESRVVTTPAYMHPKASITDISAGILAMVEALAALL